MNYKSIKFNTNKFTKSNIYDIYNKNKELMFFEKKKQRIIWYHKPSNSFCDENIINKINDDIDEKLEKMEEIENKIKIDEYLFENNKIEMINRECVKVPDKLRI